LSNSRQTPLACRKNRNDDGERRARAAMSASSARSTGLSSNQCADSGRIGDQLGQAGRLGVAVDDRVGGLLIGLLAELELVDRLDLAGKLAQAAVPELALGGPQQRLGVVVADLADDGVADRLAAPGGGVDAELAIGTDVDQAVFGLLGELLEGDGARVVDVQWPLPGRGPIRVEGHVQPAADEFGVGGVHRLLDGEVVVPVQLEAAGVLAGGAGVAGRAQVMLAGQPALGQQGAQLGQAAEVVFVGDRDDRDRPARTTKPPQPVQDPREVAPAGRPVCSAVRTVQADADPAEVGVRNGRHQLVVDLGRVGDEDRGRSVELMGGGQDRGKLGMQRGLPARDDQLQQAVALRRREDRADVLGLKVLLDPHLAWVAVQATQVTLLDDIHDRPHDVQPSAVAAALRPRPFGLANQLGRLGGRLNGDPCLGCRHGSPSLLRADRSRFRDDPISTVCR